jgi:hypothetical protein
VFVKYQPKFKKGDVVRWRPYARLFRILGFSNTDCSNYLIIEEDVNGVYLSPMNYPVRELDRIYQHAFNGIEIFMECL